MIAVLLGTYNGEKYLHEQLESLLDQTYDDFIIHAQDDASTDGTWGILAEYQGRHPGKFRIYQRNSNSGSPKTNFLELMSSVQDEYVMLCDQDDIWLPNKIEITLEKMQSLEASCPDEPALVYTDTTIVNEDLSIVDLSYRNYMRSDFTKNAPNQVLAQAVFPGCTAMYNRRLAGLLTESPEYCVMHDWWLHLVAAVFGKIDYLEAPTVLYRQHVDNQIGARDMRKLGTKMRWLFKGKEIRIAIQSTYRQAESFLSIYADNLRPSHKELIQSYCQLPHKNKLARWHSVIKMGAFKIGLARNIAYFMWL